MASAASRMAFERTSIPMPHRTEPYHIISAGPQYTKIDQNGIRSIFSIKQLTFVSEEGRTNVDVKSDSRRKRTSTLLKRRRHTVKRTHISPKTFLDPKTDLRGHILLLVGIATNVRTFPCSPPNTSSFQSFWEEFLQSFEASRHYCPDAVPSLLYICSRRPYLLLLSGGHCYSICIAGYFCCFLCLLPLHSE